MQNITYRPMVMADLSLRMIWLNDPAVNKYLGVRDINNLDFFQEWMNGYFADETKEIFINMADEKPVGQVGLVDINLYDKNAALYIVIGEADYRGKGIGKQAIQYILNYAFNDLDLHKVWLDVHVENLAGVKCYTNSGFIEEGRFIDQVLYSDGHYGDEFRMYIINPKM
jgi:RimJ/RimL family protein N-acetyltransferase